MPAAQRFRGDGQSRRKPRIPGKKPGKGSLGGTPKKFFAAGAKKASAAAAADA
jgi:hypothetical protein